MKSCDTCQRSNKKLKKASGPLNPIPVKAKLWHQVGIDLIGPLPQTAQGNKYNLKIPLRHPSQFTNILERYLSIEEFKRNSSKENKYQPT